MKSVFNIGVAAFAAALLIVALAPGVHAADIRKSRQARDLSAAQKEALFDTLSDATQPFFAEEEKKKADGKPYVDLRYDMVQYLPNYGSGGRVIVSVKLGGAEYDPASKASSKGAATGKLRYLVLSYSFKDRRWVEYKKPKWQEQNLGAKAATKITADRTRRDEREAALEARKAAAAKAAADKAAAAKAAEEAAAKAKAAQEAATRTSAGNPASAPKSN
ncbi:MAG: hypothetical protein ACREQB_13175 [Candidatus Binataceae bacterium]